MRHFVSDGPVQDFPGPVRDRTGPWTSLAQPSRRNLHGTTWPVNLKPANLRLQGATFKAQPRLVHGPVRTVVKPVRTGPSLTGSMILGTGRSISNCHNVAFAVHTALLQTCKRYFYGYGLVCAIGIIFLRQWANDSNDSFWSLTLIWWKHFHYDETTFMEPFIGQVWLGLYPK